MELATANVALLGVEVGSNSIYSGGIAHKDNLVGQLLWFQMQMEA
jgi:hypothetical protein